jgi:hypothetical protein
MTEFSAEELEGLRYTSGLAMPDTCTVKRLAYPGTAELDAETLLYTPTTPTTVYAGACRIRPVSTRDGIQRRDDTPISSDQYLLTVPHDEGPFAVGDIAQVTVSDDPHITSRSWRITSVPAGSWQIDQRLVVEEVIDRG